MNKILDVGSGAIEGKMYTICFFYLYFPWILNNLNYKKTSNLQCFMIIMKVNDRHKQGIF